MVLTIALYHGGARLPRLKRRSAECSRVLHARHVYLFGEQAASDSAKSSTMTGRGVHAAITCCAYVSMPRNLRLILNGGVSPAGLDA
jgi:hypothetical protein